MVTGETASGWRWQRIGDPRAPVKLLGEPPAGELRDAGVSVTAYQCDLPRLSRCPVCGRGAVRWVASMTLPGDVRLPLGRGCSPDHAVAIRPVEEVP